LRQKLFTCRVCTAPQAQYRHVHVHSRSMSGRHEP
jgi:hypothetical protein